MRIKDLAADANQDETADEFWSESMSYLPETDAEQVSRDGEEEGDNADDPKGEGKTTQGLIPSTYK